MTLLPTFGMGWVVSEYTPKHMFEVTYDKVSEHFND